MNRYPAWLNLLVLSVFLLGTILALPNIYGSSPAVQMVNADNSVFTEQQLENVVGVLENMKIIPCKLSDYIAKITLNETNAYLTIDLLFD